MDVCLRVNEAETDSLLEKEVCVKRKIHRMKIIRETKKLKRRQEVMCVCVMFVCVCVCMCLYICVCLCVCVCECVFALYGM